MLKYSTGVGGYGYNSADAVCSKLVATTVTAMWKMAVKEKTVLKMKLNLQRYAFNLQRMGAREIFWYD